MPALLKDDRIRYRRAERRAFIEHQVTAFVLTNANVSAVNTAALFVGTKTRFGVGAGDLARC